MFSFLKKILRKSDGINIPRSPHEIFPEIMHWELRDQLSDPKSNVARYMYHGSNENGDVFLSDSGKIKKIINIKQAMRYKNHSLIERKRNKEKKLVSEYMQMISDMKKAYKEISE